MLRRSSAPRGPVKQRIGEARGAQAVDVRVSKSAEEKASPERERGRCADVHVIPRWLWEVMQVGRVDLQVERGTRDAAQVNFKGRAPVPALLPNRARTRLKCGAWVDREHDEVPARVASKSRVRPRALYGGIEIDVGGLSGGRGRESEAARAVPRRARVSGR